ncbi:MAG: iron-containing alcohol dehydrogenase, partial [Candidatus Sericytochromatia bacterium]
MTFETIFETIFEQGAVARLGSYLRQWGSRRVLLILGPSRRFENLVRAQLEGLALEVEVYAGAKVHVPVAVVQEAKELLERFQPDTLITLGGGAATGLGKVLRLQQALKFVAIPTTYAGSEMTSIYGTTEAGHKTTGRNPEVHPDLVLYDPELSATLPKKQTITSLLNALAHPIAALQDPGLEPEIQHQALEAIESLCLVVEDLLQAPGSRGARLEALRGAAMAGSVLERAQLGSHHKLVHSLGGRFNLDHADLHALLLPHTLRQLAETDPAVYARIEAAAGVPDLPAVLFDNLSRAGAPTALKSLELGSAALKAALDGQQAQMAALVQAAYLGRRPSLRVRHQDWGQAEPVSVSGPSPAEARLTVIAVHGRNSQADAMLKRVSEVSGNAGDIAVIAPQASENSWYSGPYHAPLAALEPELSAALAQLDQTVARVLEQVTAERIVLCGFSQGACLVTEYLLRKPRRFGGLIALAGARIGEAWAELTPDLTGLPVLLGVADADPWVRQADVDKTAAFFTLRGAKVTLAHSSGEAHLMTLVQRVLARDLLLDQNSLKGHRGFGRVVESEALPAALPRDQNSPLRTAYGLYAEQLNGTGFVAPRHQNLRSWLYRIRPSAQHTPFVSQPHPRFCQDFHHSPPEPNLLGYGPLPIPEAATDFIAGLATFGGAGSPALRRGFALHLYAANRSMENHAFYNSDGDFLIVPQAGTLLLQTEMGVLELPPGHIGILPLGIKFSVMLKEGMARGYVAEVFGRHFELP